LTQAATRMAPVKRMTGSSQAMFVVPNLYMRFGSREGRHPNDNKVDDRWGLPGSIFGFFT
jgi:hypothetical protein